MLSSSEIKFARLVRLSDAVDKTISSWEADPLEYDEEQVAFMRLPNVSIHRELRSQILFFQNQDVKNAFSEEIRTYNARVLALKERLDRLVWLASFRERNLLQKTA